MSTRVIAVLSAAVLSVLAWDVPAHADAPWPVPDGATITIDGKGFGHGKGLSQYGARWAADEAGLSYEEIIDFYYPGTSWSTLGGQVEVLITRDTTRDVVVGARTGLSVRSLGAGRRWTLPARQDGRTVGKWRITPTFGQRSTIAFRTRAWHTWRVVAGDAQFAAGGRPIELFTPAGPVQYRGTLRSATSTGLDRDTVNILSLDSYLKGVVPREIPALWAAEAVKAQAVAARSYAAYERAHAPASRHYQLCDTAHCQVYGGYSAEDAHSNAAVDGTALQILTAAGEPAFTQFSASNGGYSVQGSFDYLPAQSDPYDHYDPGPDGVVGWRTTVTENEVATAYGLEDLAAISIDRRDGRGVFGGRVETITLTSSTSKSFVVTGQSFRQKLGLKSTLFTIFKVEQRTP